MTSSFEQLYRAHYSRVLGLCRRLLGPAGRAEDATQEVFMRALRAFESYDPAQPFAAWVTRIASNHCIDRLRRRTRETEIFAVDTAEPAELAADEPSVLAGLLTSERATAVRTAISDLPGKYRIPLVLAYYGEASYDDIAATLGITRNHVGTLILRAKRELRRTLAAATEETRP